METLHLVLKLLTSWSWPAVRRAVTVALLWATGVPATGGSEVPSSPRLGLTPLALSPCHVEGLAESLACGVHEVFENRDGQSGRRIGIHVAVMPALRRGAQPDPLFIFAGGPGQGARSMAPVAARFLRPIRRQRDIVLVDLRGTGASAPLRCPAPADELDQLTPLAAIPALIAGCLAAFDADPRFYTHRESLADVDEVRRRLGYDRVNVWGGSWGTRAALLYALRFPQAVRSVIVDGAVPLDLDFPSTASADAQRALTLLIEACQADAACEERFHDLPGDLAALARATDGRSIAPTIRHPRTGRPVTVTLTGDTPFDILRGALYVPRDAAALPLVVEAAADGDWAPLAAQFLRTASVTTDDMALGATLSVLCSEDLPQVEHADFQATAGQSLFGTGYAEVWRERCRHWPKGAGLSIDRQARSDAPALILSGLHDPVTPPRTGTAMSRHFRQSWEIVVPAAAHNATFSGCVPELIAAFLAGASGAGLDTSCAAGTRWPPFVLGMGGTAP